MSPHFPMYVRMDFLPLMYHGPSRHSNVPPSADIFPDVFLALYVFVFKARRLFKRLALVHLVDESECERTTCASIIRLVFDATNFEFEVDGIIHLVDQNLDALEHFLGWLAHKAVEEADRC